MALGWVRDWPARGQGQPARLRAVSRADAPLRQPGPGPAGTRRLACRHRDDPRRLPRRRAEPAVTRHDTPAIRMPRNQKLLTVTKPRKLASTPKCLKPAALGSSVLGRMPTADNRVGEFGHRCTDRSWELAMHSLLAA